MTQYKNPPIIEVVCEFRFSQDTIWGDDLVEEFFSVMSESFPNRENRVQNNLEFQASPKETKMQMEQKRLHAFWNQNKTMLVQLGNRYVSIHALRPYPSWKRFYPVIEEVYNTIEKLIEISHFERIGFVYIDKIEIPEQNVKLQEYFQYYPFLGPNLPEQIGLFSMTCEIPFENNRDNCRMVLGSAVPEKGEHLAFLLTTDYFLIEPSQLQPNEVLTWITCAHDHISNLFQGIITEKLELIFNEEL